MPTKAQPSRLYRILPAFLRQMREDTDLTQRALGKRLKKPQSWVYNCETGIRRVDIAEFIVWTRACDVKPAVAFNRLLKQLEQGRG